MTVRTTPFDATKRIEHVHSFWERCLLFVALVADVLVSAKEKTRLLSNVSGTGMKGWGKLKSADEREDAFKPGAPLFVCLR